MGTETAAKGKGVKGITHTHSMQPKSCLRNDLALRNIYNFSPRRKFKKTITKLNKKMEVTKISSVKFYSFSDINFPVEQPVPSKPSDIYHSYNLQTGEKDLIFHQQCALYL